MTITTDDSKNIKTFDIMANRSLSREGMIIFFIAIFVVSVLLAVRFFILGAWIVLPFTLLEMLILGISWYMYERSSRCWQRIVVNSKEVQVSNLQGSNTLQDWMFNAYWVSVVFKPDPRKWYPSKLFIKSHTEKIRIGKCLTEDDRKALAEDLKNSLEMSRRVT